MVASVIENLKRFIKKETVFCISDLAAVLSMFLVPPNIGYLGYIDWRVIVQLFCLMCVTAQFVRCGLLGRISGRISGAQAAGAPTRVVALALCFCCFFSSMLITNDVALLTFVPLTVTIFRGDERNLMFTVAFESAAANLGSMATPVGNPQNLYLYSYYNMKVGDFLSAVLPFTLASALLCAAGILLTVKNRGFDSCDVKIKTIEMPQDNKNTPSDGKIKSFAAVRTAILFVLCIAAVLGAVDYRICLAAVVAVSLICDRGVFLDIDYILLATFVCFFVFVGNIGSVGVIREFVTKALSGGVTLISALISQAISNVPAAVMLAPFTFDATALLRGVNIGGLGTLVASLASLIAFKLYSKHEGSRRGEYMLIFTAVNIALLIPLSILAVILS